jgi:hypothetical protein
MKTYTLVVSELELHTIKQALAIAALRHMGKLPRLPRGRESSMAMEAADYSMLLEKVSKVIEGRMCPHGRPTVESCPPCLQQRNLALRQSTPRPESE